MRVFQLKGAAKSSEAGEYILGLEELHTHAVYLIYGVLHPGEKGRKVHPGRGHEEILCIAKGKLRANSGHETFSMEEGEAIHLHEEDVFYLENDADEVSHYVLAGGHIMEHHH
ncbi:MAG: hypothetical protein ACE5PM_00490 [Candidatus Hydrothermarchaeales archaeon]